MIGADFFNPSFADSHRAAGAAAVGCAFGRACCRRHHAGRLHSVGLTDAMPAATAMQSAAESCPRAGKGSGPEAQTVTLRGLCVDQVDKSAIGWSPGAVVQGTGPNRADR